MNSSSQLVVKQKKYGLIARCEVRSTEWPTVAVALICYGGFLAATAWADTMGHWLAAAILVVVLTLHSSLQHEIIHGHPFRSKSWNTLLAFPPIGLLIPFERFRHTHLAHHQCQSLTDPYDDPESNYVDSAQWLRLPSSIRNILIFNNSVIGRITVGPAISLLRLYYSDLRALIGGARGILWAYMHHIIGLSLLSIWLFNISTLPWWLHLVCAYSALSVLKVRTFLEHCAFEQLAHRTAIVEDRGLLALLFLKNNLHAVHHAHPGLPWYRLQSAYDERRTEIINQNNGYVYRSYGSVISQYFFNVKDPVTHPHSRLRAEEKTDPANSQFSR